MLSISVVNVNHLPSNSYEYIGRGSVLGNPYIIGKHGNREQVIALYKRLLWQQIKSLGPMGLEVMRLAACILPITLGCHCKPLPCHGDVVRAAIHWVRSQA